MLTKAYIPYKGYYSTPFSRWQGKMANENALTLGAKTSKKWLGEKEWDPKIFDYLILGMTIGQPQWFFGSMWAAALIGHHLYLPGGRGHRDRTLSKRIYLYDR